jgi:hypothetical protein
VARSENRLFFPQSALDEWIVDGSVELVDGQLVILSEGLRFRLTEAVRVLEEVSGSGDMHDLRGRVKDRAELEGLGAELVESSMLLGDAAFDTVPGWSGVPVRSPVDRRESSAGDGKGEAELKSDEESLLRFLAKNA